MKKHIAVSVLLLVFATSVSGQIAGVIGPYTIFVEKGQKCPVIQNLMSPSSDYVYYLNWEYTYLDGAENWIRLSTQEASGLSYDPGYPARPVKYRRIMTCYQMNDTKFYSDPVYIYIKEDGMFAGHVEGNQNLTLGQATSKLWLRENPVNCDTYHWEYAYSMAGPWYQSYYGDYTLFPYTPAKPLETVYFRLAGTRTSPNRTIYSNIVCLNVTDDNWIDGQHAVNKYEYVTLYGSPLASSSPDFQYWWEQSTSGGDWSHIGDSYGIGSYTTSKRMEQTTYYRRVIGCPYWQYQCVSNVICITVLPAKKNYIKTNTTTAYGYSSPSSTGTTIHTFDSFGRPEESIKWNITPSGNDLVTLQEYDDMGRPSAVWLPASVKAGVYVNPVTLKTGSRQTNLGDTAPYAVFAYEAAPSNRIVGQTNPGSQWQNKPIRTEYLINSGYMSSPGDPPLADQHLSCVRFDIDGENGIKRMGLYPSNTLYVVQVTDEDGNVSLEYKDNLGHIILSRQITGNIDYVDTYYVYDVKANLRYVLPPVVADSLSVSDGTWNDDHDILNKYAFIYKYDSRNRCIRKKLPGTDWVYYVYDKANDLIFTQDGMRRIAGEWSFSVPDKLGRPAVSGICSGTIPGVSVYAGTGIAPGSFDNLLVMAERNVQSTDGYEILFNGINIGTVLGAQLIVNYYDDYDFLSHVSSVGGGLGYTAGGGYGARYEPGNYHGLLTGTLTRVIDGDDDMFNLSAFYYDYRNRLVQSKAFHGVTGAYVTECYQYDFTGNVLKKLEKHDFGGTNTEKLESTFTYDQSLRMLSETTVLNGNMVSQAKVTYAYNELGQLASKTYGTGQNAITETCDYNIQGWLTEKKSDVFDMRLRYHDPQKPGTEASWTGNITEWEWQHKGADADNPANTYAFSYDKLSRLTDTKRYEGSSTLPTNAFTEQDIDYDRNGNMLAMKRYMSDASTPDEDMEFTNYNGNQLVTMENNGVSHNYEYDRNGNMITDGLNALKLNYNFLNLTSSVSDMSENVQATYSWLANGEKVGVKNAAGTSGYEYTGSLVYKYVNGGLQLESAAFGDGRIMVSEGSNGTIYTPNYYITDHLGSTRAVVTADGTVIEQNDYYPFGSRHENPQLAVSDNRFRFSGKEDQTIGDLPYQDFTARFFGKKLPIFTTPDPLSEIDYPISPYAYCRNNPIRHIDTDGQVVRIANNAAGAMENMARIAATSFGNQVMRHLIGRNETYMLNSTFFTTSSQYKYKSNTINYVANPWYSQIPMDGGALTSMIAMGHESFHAFDHSLSSGFFRSDAHVAAALSVLEPRAVSFSNYLRDAYSLYPLREQYGSIEGNFHQFGGNEKISNFTTLGSNTDKTSYGFSYTKTTTTVDKYKTILGIKIPDKTTTTSATYYMTVGMDDKENATFQIYNNEEEYRKATQDW